MLVIALTGGIGSGKTTVSDIFKSKNVSVIDTDIIAREIVEKDKPAYFEIIHLFGNEILSGNKNIDRKALRKRVFSSEKKRLQLEDILHPRIWNEVESQVLSITSKKPSNITYCIVVVPLLVENLSQIKMVIFDRILVIDIPEELQLKRSMKRDNSDTEVIESIIKSQVSRQARLDVADDIIVNTESLDALNKTVEHLHLKYLKLSE